MTPKIVLVSGPVGGGKSTLCAMLEEQFGFKHIMTREFIEEEYPKAKRARRVYQELGESLDRRTKGAWVRDGLQRRMTEDLPDTTTARVLSGTQDVGLSQHGPIQGAGNSDGRQCSGIAVDAVRIKRQIDAVRKAYGPRVVHVHLTAPDKVLASRYKERKRQKPSGWSVKEMASYKAVAENATEAGVGGLAKYADIVIDTNRCTKEDVLTRAAAYLGLHDQECCPLVDVIVGGQYGSEGKGHITSYLSREYGLLVRVGGPNAGHTVYGEPKKVFHQLPSGSHWTKPRLLVGPGAVISIERLMTEIAKYGITADRLSVDPQAVVIQDEDRDEEKALVEGIGSTGQGVGAATARRIMGRCNGSVLLAKDTGVIKPFIREAAEVLEQAYRAHCKILLEGTQGTALSLYHGHYPHVTSRDTTVPGCLAEAGIPPHRVRKVVMVTRTFPIRVQDPKGKGKTSGPMSQEITWREVARRSGLSLKSIKNTEITTTTKRQRRVGEFDWRWLRKAVVLNGPTDIALTFTDYFDKKNQRARRFEQLTDDTIRFIQEIERVAGAPASLISTRFAYRSIIDRRAW